MGNSLLKTIVREACHDGKLTQLSQDDHATKQHGGTPTHGAGNHVTPGTAAGKSEMADVAKAATGTCGPHNSYRD
jgi:hypothetical protein